MSGIEVQIRLKPVPQSAWTASETVLFRQDTRFVFNHVHGQHVSNHVLFQSIEPFVNAAFTGQNVTVMAYGQTGSGKTHSMLGKDSEQGFIPRAAETLLKLAASHGGVSISGSCIEVYNETLRDLLSIDREVVLSETTSGTAVDKSSFPIHSMSDYQVMSTRAENNRRYGVTDMNEHSSRSHTILSFDVIRQSTGARAILNFVDLAGSESSAKSNTLGQQLREGGFINKSLLALGNVVDAIVDGRSHIPYRESKLTRVLRSCLGGRSLAYILACVNPAYENVSETTAALRFAQRAMKIKNDPTVALHAPPLMSFHLQRQLNDYGESMKVLSNAAFEQGLYDSYTYCVASVSDIVQQSEKDVETAVQDMFAVNIALLAHEKKTALDRIANEEQMHAARDDRIESLKAATAADQRRALDAEQNVLQAEKRIAEGERRIRAKRESRERDEMRLNAALEVALSNQMTSFMELECHELNERLAILMDERQLFYAIFDEFFENFAPNASRYEGVPIHQLLKILRDEVKTKRDETDELEGAVRLAMEGLEEFDTGCRPQGETLDVEERIFDLEPRRTAIEPQPVARPAASSRRRVAQSVPISPGTPVRRLPPTQVRTPPASQAARRVVSVVSPGAMIKSTISNLREVQSRYMNHRNATSPSPTPKRTVQPRHIDATSENVDVENIVGIAMRRRIERELSVQRSLTYEAASPAESTAVSGRRPPSRAATKR